MENDKDKHILTRGQRIGLLELAGIALLVVVCVHILPPHLLRSSATETPLTDTLLFDSTNCGGYAEDKPRIARPFDPNTADSMTLVAVGFRPWHARMILNYRRKGGRYYQAEDLMHIPYMSDSLYRAILPYVRIDTMTFHQERMMRQYRRDSIRLHWDSLHRADSLRWDSIRLSYKHRGHEKKDTILDLNRADTSELQYLRGIGPSTAMAIVRYRQRLGGYYSVAQLRDSGNHIPPLADSLLLRLTVDRDSIRPIRVNTAGIKVLCRHPYLNYKQAEAIYTLRRTKFRLGGIEELRALKELSEADLQRLAPYLSFEKTEKFGAKSSKSSE